MCETCVMNKKFTLIELLVVIAIIGILASLLLPSMAKAREKARIAVEVSNRKQLYTATVMYSGDNSDKYPYRGENAVWLHVLKNGTKNLNLVLVDKYLGEGDEVRTEMMFCDSTLMTVRAPDSFAGYDANYCTLNYYVIPKNSGSLLDTDFQNISFMNTEPDNALWSCMVLYKPGGNTWLGHNAPSTGKATDGASTVFVDGGAKWVYESSYKILWTGGAGFEFYRPIR